MLSVTVVQEASGLDPAGNRARLPDLVPADSDLVVLPEAFARDFGEAGSDVSPYAEAAGRRLRHRARPRWPRERNTTVVAGMFETSADPGRPFNTLLVRGAVDGVVPQDPPLRLLRLPGVRRADRRARSSRWWSTSRGFRLGLMTCYDLRFPELARLLVDRGRRGAGRPGRLGGRAAQGRPLAHAGPRPGHREHRLRGRRRPARPALHRPLAGRRPARRRAGRGRRGGRRCCAPP